MGRRHAISDADGNRVKDLLPGQPGPHGGLADDNRRFLDAVLGIARTGPRGGGSTGGRRPAAGRRGRPCSATPTGTCWSWIPPPSAPTRPPPVKKTADGSGGQADEALGRSRGGFGTTIHGGMNELGQPVELARTDGQASDIGPAEALLADHAPEVVIADTGYDGDAFVAVIEGHGAEAVIPSRANRSEPRTLDRHTYKEGSVVERFRAQAKPFRRVATRYEKKAANFLSFVWVASLMVMLK